MLIVLLLVGALIGAFFSDKFKRFRLYLILAIPLLLIFIGVAVVMSVPYAIAFVLGFAGAYYGLRDKFKAAGKAPKPTTFGSAEWASMEYLLKCDPPLVQGEGYWLGWFVDAYNRRHPITYSGDRHLLTVAPTRAGKGVSAIIPNLLTYKGSALVIDPKGENARITSRQRKTMGQTVHVVDPWGITGLPVAQFNPLDWLEPGDPDLGENAFMLADAMVVRSGHGESAFWDDESVALLWGLILYVALDTNPGRDRSLGGVRDLISLGEAPMNELLKEMAAHPNEIVSSTGERTLAKEAKVRANVFTSVQAQTHFLDSPRIRQNMSRSSFQFEDLKTGLATVYLVLPADRLGTFNRWLRLLIQQAITVNARNIQIEPERPILFLLDEMAALGKLTKVEEAYGLMAGFGMQLWGIVQDLSQLDRIYDKGWETFIGNSGVLQYLGSRDLKTAAYFSKLCGVGTIVKQSFSRSIARAFSSEGGNSTTTTSGSNDDHIARPLALPDELMVLRKDQELLLIENHNPIQAERIFWFRDDRLKQLGDALPRRQKGLQQPSTTIPARLPVSAAHVQPTDAGYPPAAS